MSNKPGNELAFPDYEAVYDRDGSEFTLKGLRSIGGMSLREWYAGKAMQGMLANPQLAAAHAIQASDSDKNVAEITASIAKVYADALIAELEKK